MKMIAYYLPQFHEIPENNEWWGEGYTEWRNARRARPLFGGQYQPREPLGDRYYDLADDSVMEWQMKLARKYGIGGFCFYHYWFGDGRKLLEMPAERMLKNPKADLPFCFSWANEPWTRTWEGPGGEKHVLINQKYCGKEDWKAHFDYLLPFFRDKRYIRKDGRPVFLIYRIDKIPCARAMFDYWNELAEEAGLGRLYLIQMLSNSRYKRRIADAYAAYAPAIFFELRDEAKKKLRYRLAEGLRGLRPPGFLSQWLFDVYDYDKCCRYLLDKKYEENEYMGMFPDFDNTARRGVKAAIWKGANPGSFEKYLTEAVRMSQKAGKEFLFLTAWNEWGEGNYLEPDKRYGYGWLHAVKRALHNGMSGN